MPFKPLKKRNKSPRFFCENCDSEVPKGAKKCPNCGRYFASVRCPACDYIGEEALFRGGCPVCGYSAATDSGRGRQPLSKGKTKVSALPFWVYIFFSAVFTAILAAIFFGQAK